MDSNKIGIVLRAVGLTALTSVFAPALCNTLVLVSVAVARSSPVNVGEMIGLGLWAVILGWLPAIVCCVLALPAVWVALCFGVASLWAFVAGGAGLALAQWAVVTSVRSMIESTEMTIALAVTGAVFGMIWWKVLARAAQRSR